MIQLLDKKVDSTQSIKVEFNVHVTYSWPDHNLLVSLSLR